MKTNQHIKSVPEINNLVKKTICAIVVVMMSTQLSTAQDFIASPSTANYDGVQKDTLNEAISISNAKVINIVNDYYRGTQDADGGYTAKKSGRRSIFFASLIGTPVLAIIPAIISASTIPKVRNLHIANDSLLHNAAYMRGYKDEAHDIKKKAVWGNYLAGSVIWIGVVNLLLL
ncbi:MAG TPA: hypothetical protein VN922_22895 [Bacteroidia bacterium]|nr:hypothetical protein [Bacteroidia bacterium]